MPPNYSNGGSLDGRALRRLCEPILLVESFSFAFQHCAPSRMIKPEVHRQRPQTAKDRFIKFVYKLALVSAFAPGGATVTSMAIFENSRGILYVLASNYASPEQKEEMTAHVKSLLAMIASTNNQQDLRGQKRNVLRKILLFNKIRIRAYLGMIVTCVNACQMEGIRNGTVIQALRGLESSLTELAFEDGDDDDYIDTCNRCLDQIRDNKGVFAHLGSLAESHVVNLGNVLKTNSWVELQHSISRLYSYEEAMMCFFDAWQEWPRLFQEPEFHILPSNQPRSHRFGKRSFTAEAIVGRMSGQPDKIKEYRGITEDLKKFNIDERLRKTSDGFKLYVHSEIQVYDWVNHSKEAGGLRFFNDWRFIGASKPTCRLCKYYIESANAAEQTRRGLQPIEVRPSNHNLYPHWAFPNAHDWPKSTTSRVWQKTFDRMIKLVRDDAFRILEEKSCRGKKHDSNTYDEWSTRASQVGGDEAMARLSERFGQGLSLRTTRLGDDSDEDGGVIL